MAKNTAVMYEPMAKLSLDSETRAWADDIIARIEDEFSKLEGVVADGVEPLVTVLDLKNVLREDVSCQIVSRETLLENAPEEYDGYFQVPKTLE